ncbi:DUF481 domain-containing protein [Thiomicrorhabdus heinhorstiae]|uniref:DUF481 domain-containing protein n=1 Tax=Thiomicrorhabdus heinhorstiae TaxID=2748010 RepID=A0ABS0BSI9_9GAMM|nr:DUF481 domain-containing protein [Thiomicrorhabdus heinhorstiae]MBF6056835.1 DUF481 domain-containing protein [Thiomicrorhabdus heinhorstiae]
MKQRFIRTIIVAGMATLPFSASAVDTDLKYGLSGSGEIGFTNNTGNTESTILYAGLKGKYVQPVYEIRSLIEAQYQSENSVQTQERYLLDVQGNRFYSRDRGYYSYVGARFEKSRFEFIDLDSIYSLGLGKDLYRTEQTKATGEIGIGYQITDYSSSTTEKDSDQLIGRLKIDLDHSFNDVTAFHQDLTLTTGYDQSKVESNTGLKFKIADQLKLSATYKYRYNSKPAAGIKDVDTQTILTLIYDF